MSLSQQQFWNYFRNVRHWKIPWNTATCSPGEMHKLTGNRKWWVGICVVRSLLWAWWAAWRLVQRCSTALGDSGEASSCCVTGCVHSGLRSRAFGVMVQEGWACSWGRLSLFGPGTGPSSWSVWMQMMPCLIPAAVLTQDFVTQVRKYLTGLPESLNYKVCKLRIIFSLGEPGIC